MAVSKALTGTKGLTWRQHQGNLVRNLRMSLGLSQTEFADVVGVSSNMVCCVETGRSNIPPERVALFAAALEVDLRSLAIFVAYAQNPDVGALIWPSLTTIFEQHARQHREAAETIATAMRGRKDWL